MLPAPILSLSLLAALLPAACASAPDLPQRGVAAHRGASSSHPENTLTGFLAAVALGAHQIEFDVRLTRDGVPVVMHDARVDRTTDGIGLVAELTWAQVARLDAGSWKHPRFSGERVPSLRAALAVMPRNLWINVHLKGGAEVGAAAAREVAAAGRLDQAFLACGPAAAAAAREAVPRILICDMDRPASSQQYVDQALARGADFIQFYGADAVDPLWTARLAEGGVRINYCCTDEPARMRELLAAGVEFVLVDDLPAMLEAALALGIEPLRPRY